MSSNNNVTNPKCSNCKCYFTPTIKSSGQLFKTCDKCRTKNKETRVKNNCPHDKRKSQCRVCKGSSFCIHDKRKSQCRDCDGTSFCIHNKYKTTCKECGSRSICEHNREKRNCKECNEKLCFVRCHSKQIKTYLTSTRYEKIKNHYNDNLGCTVEEFINHIKMKIEYFNTYSSTTDQMTLNHIHIDNNKPMSQFHSDDADEFLECCHYSNIQPLLSESNLTKSSKWSEENNKYWLDNIKGKEYNERYFP
jgi:hypothetical protein